MPQNDEYILDRWEGGTAVLEGPDGRLLDVPRSQLPLPGPAMCWCAGGKAGKWISRPPRPAKSGSTH